MGDAPNLGHAGDNGGRHQGHRPMSPAGQDKCRAQGNACMQRNRPPDNYTKIPTTLSIAKPVARPSVYQKCVTPLRGLAPPPGRPEARLPSPQPPAGGHGGLPHSAPYTRRTNAPHARRPRPDDRRGRTHPRVRSLPNALAGLPGCPTPTPADNNPAALGTTRSAPENPEPRHHSRKDTPEHGHGLANGDSWPNRSRVPASMRPTRAAAPIGPTP